MATTHSPDRLAAFTDAIVAIAITLLVLPLVDAASDEINEGSTFVAFFTDHWGQFVSFLISFAVIARMWAGHHRLFEHLRSYTPRIFMLTILWSFTIVLLPLPTAMTANFAIEPGVIAFYITTMAVSSLTLTLLVLTIRGSSSEDPENPVPVGVLINSALTTALFIVALIVGSLVVVINYFALFLLVLSWPINKIIDARMNRDGEPGSRTAGKQA
ncbi:TMEM175 family protein [Paramicrobacterium sp. CJ85]|uniref:TMEM175 family protein n=1 Tax=Paramicrobacterium sp. CJ85 TaxID=3445355 RepID=UPI003F63B6B8